MPKAKAKAATNPAPKRALIIRNGDIALSTAEAALTEAMELFRKARSLYKRQADQTWCDRQAVRAELALEQVRAIRELEPVRIIRGMK